MGGEPDDGDRAAGTSVERDEWTISGQQIAAAMLAWGLAFARYSCAERATLYAVLTQVEVTDEEPLWPLVCRRVGERELAEIAHIDSAELRRCWKRLADDGVLVERHGDEGAGRPVVHVHLPEGMSDDTFAADLVGKSFAAIWDMELPSTTAEERAIIAAMLTLADHEGVRPANVDRSEIAALLDVPVERVDAFVKTLERNDERGFLLYNAHCQRGKPTAPPLPPNPARSRIVEVVAPRGWVHYGQGDGAAYRSTERRLVVMVFEQVDPDGSRWRTLLVSAGDAPLTAEALVFAARPFLGPNRPVRIAPAPQRNLRAVLVRESLDGRQPMHCLLNERSLMRYFKSQAAFASMVRAAGRSRRSN